MILTDKPYIITPTDNTSLMHYLNLHQLLSILNFNHLTFSSVVLYSDLREATLSAPSYNAVFSFNLLEDNTPVLKSRNYLSRRQMYKSTRPVTIGASVGSNILSEKTIPGQQLDKWKRDTFANLLHSFVRYFMFTHCWSVSNTESVLMWDRYKDRGAMVAIKTTVEKMKNAFRAKPNQLSMPLYIGEIQYKDYKTEHITSFENYSNEDLSDSETIERLFYQPVFHKQIHYEAEKEVRLIISYEHWAQKISGNSFFTNIPFYENDWGFVENNNHGFKVETIIGTRNDNLQDILFDSRNAFYFNNGIHGENCIIPNAFKIGVDIHELIENIIISPYAESGVHNLIQHVVSKYGIDSKKVVKSSIEIK